MAVDNTKRVTGKVTALSITRDVETVNGSPVHMMKVSWKIPSSLTDENRADRATWLDSNINFNAQRKTHPSGQVWHPEGDVPAGGLPITYTGYDFYWVKGIGLHTSYDKPFDRSRFHPITKGAYCYDVAVTVHGGNASGVGGWDPDDRNASGRGPDAQATYRFVIPEEPDIEFAGWSEENNYAVEYTVKSTNDSKTTAERYDVCYRILRQDNIPNSGYAKRKAIDDWTANELTEINDTVVGPPNVRALSDGQWVEFTLEAYTRGMAGDSRKVSTNLIASRPARAIITGIKVSSLDTVNGIVTVSCKTPRDEHRVTTRAQLQRLKDVDGSLNAQQVSLLSGWTDVTGMVDIEEQYQEATWSTGFCDSVASAKPTSYGLRTWYRVVTENDLYFDDNAYMSVPVEASKLYQAPPVPATVTFASVKSTDDGDGIRVLMGWNAESTEYTGTEISWSDKPDAWESSDKPSPVDVTWKDATSQVSGKNRSASFTIYGLEQGTLYYIRARRYLETDAGRTYGAYSTPASGYFPFAPTTAPKDVVLNAPAFVPRGEDVPLTWTFSAESPQTAWAVYKVENGGRTALASGDDAYGSCSIPASLATEDMTIVLAMTTGSEWAESVETTVHIADPPEVTVEMELTNGVLTAQPISLSFANSTGDEEVRTRIVSNGVTNVTPSGDADQTAGYVVFDAWTMPEWYMGRTDILADLDLPDGLELVDNGTYTLECWSRNRTTGLVSEMDPIEFKVTWSHQAAAPSDATVETYPSDRVAVVTPTAPSGASQDDVFDVYRVTPDGVDLIAQGLQYGSAVSDRYAPFGGTYRIATRTKDGDVDWLDADYEMKCHKMRIDWDESNVELPYNLVRQDSWSKDFERRQHLDGSRPGFWNEGASRDATLSTDLIRLSSEDEQLAVRELASYSGPCFVRLPNGCAYQANVDVSGFSESYNSGAIEVQLTANQVDLTDEFRVATTEAEYAEVGNA